MRNMLIMSALITLSITMAGCASLANRPMITGKLKMVSAGHTGCPPDAIEISNVKAEPDGSGTWNAACNGKSYLCSGVSTGGGNSESFSCALAQ